MQDEFNLRNGIIRRDLRKCNEEEKKGTAMEMV